ncbi:ATP-binding cassette sub-family G member 1 [Onthophagus taurus]|uniref:ATP-binding cassette sub-family G member 1 n=1 Tax=Onthophagus taurus TaxID=166361 RepID=UPI000C2092C4|nr:ATP-binding cassette sub-family G member 1 [Onthophagus taurus]XP_022899889.1 ATP-binding cassette sub-family G member 1 [Onthophagus taurus]
MDTKVDKKNRVSKCCQSDSMTSINVTPEDNGICEALNDFVTSPGDILTNLMNNNHQKDDKYAYHRFAKKDPVDIKFENVYYRALMIHFQSRIKIERKEILHGVSGEFNSGELTAIMGPSGAGKSTLLNILAGYITRGSEGTIMMNDSVRDESPKFRKLVAYIPQDEELRLSLTAIENMTVAAHLKLGYSVSTEYKMKQVVQIMQLLGLQECHNTMTQRLSGGQRKRLAIALELLSNPPIIFLDEPTTGLDSLSCTQCVELLRKLARDGRTVVCTIHQPSALIFEKFDKLYALSDGNCIYNGTIPDLVPYLGNIGLQCPNYHNPADFLMEVAIGEHGTTVQQLADYHRESELKAIEQSEKVTEKNKEIMDSTKTIPVDTAPQPANVLMQFLLLYKRNLVMATREYSLYVNRLMAHVLIAFLFGYLYLNCGIGANTVLANYVYLYGSLLLVVYTGQMSVTLSFPLEMKVLAREHFNRWYKLTPYLLSGILIEIPFQLLCTWSYVAITYWLTSQPVDQRLYFFMAFCTLSTLCAQAWGYFIGATTPIKIAVFIGPVLACLFSIFGFCIRYYDTPVMFRWMFHISYFRAGFQGLVYSVYGLPRPNLYCPETELYCHYLEPKKFLTEMEVIDINLWSNISFIIVVSFLMHVATYAAVWFKLHKR